MVSECEYKVNFIHSQTAKVTEPICEFISLLAKKNRYSSANEILKLNLVLLNVYRIKMTVYNLKIVG